MRIGYSTWSMFATPYQEFLPRLHQIGYTAIALNVSPGGGRRPNATNLATLTPDDVGRIKQECQRRGIEIDAVMGHRSLVSRDPEEAMVNLQRLRDTIDFCVEVAPRGQPRPPAVTSTAGGRPTTYEEDKSLLIDRLGELTRYAASRGVIVGLEAHANTCINTPQRSAEVLGAIDSLYCRLDYDSSHFEVQLMPMEEVVPAVVPWTVVCDIKDQRVRYADEPEPDGWRIAGNGSDRGIAPDGRPIEYQWVVGGQGGYDLPRFLRLMQQAGWTGALCYEMSVHVQGRPDYDWSAAGEQTYRWMAAAWQEAAIPTE